MSGQLKELYSKLDLEDKKNEINKELLSLLMLIESKVELYNYIKNNNISDDEFLTESYMQILELKRAILKLIG